MSLDSYNEQLRTFTPPRCFANAHKQAYKVFLVHNCLANSVHYFKLIFLFAHSHKRTSPVLHFCSSTENSGTTSNTRGGLIDPGELGRPPLQRVKKLLQTSKHSLAKLKLTTPSRFWCLHSCNDF